MKEKFLIIFIIQPSPSDRRSIWSVVRQQPSFVIPFCDTSPTLYGLIIMRFDERYVIDFDTLALNCQLGSRYFVDLFLLGRINHHRRLR